MTVNENRFEFAGFSRTAIQDTNTHQIEIGRIQDGDAVFGLQLIRNKGFLHLNFLLAKVMDLKGTTLWDFKKENFNGVGVLAKAADSVVIALMGPGKEGAVERVIPLAKLVSEQPFDIRKLTRMKILAAEFLGRKHKLSEIEKSLMGADHARRQAQEEEEARATQEAREAAREERIKRILARGQVVCFTADGNSRHGLPVLETEWQSLSNGVNVVVVRSVDDTTGAIGPFVEAFRVVKKHGKNPEKGHALPVYATKPVGKVLPTAADRSQPVGKTVIDKNGEALEVELYVSIEAIRHARAAGLNGGTLVAVRAMRGEKIEVHAVHTDRMDTMGLFMPII